MPQFPLSPKKSNPCSIAITQHKLSHHNGFQKHQPLNFFEELFSGYYSYHIQYQIFFIRNSAAEFSLRLLNQNVLFRLNVVKGLIKINKICPRLSGLFWQQLSFHVRKFFFEKTFCFEYRMSPGLIYANISLGCFTLPHFQPVQCLFSCLCLCQNFKRITTQITYS